MVCQGLIKTSVYSTGHCTCAFHPTQLSRESNVESSRSEPLRVCAISPLVDQGLLDIMAATGFALVKVLYMQKALEN